MYPGIRTAILDGDIDKAFKYTHAHYPKVLVEHEEVHFKLKCRKFIEMVRKASLLRSAGSSVKSNGHGSDGGVQIMDVDDGIDDDADSVDQERLTTLESHFLQYGQTLQKDYENSPSQEVQKVLTEIWSLVAYPNPLQEPRVSHLLDVKARVAVAEELNSTILSKFGRSPFSFSSPTDNATPSIFGAVVASTPREAVRANARSPRRSQERGQRRRFLLHGSTRERHQRARRRLRTLTRDIRQSCDSPLLARGFPCAGDYPKGLEGGGLLCIHESIYIPRLTRNTREVSLLAILSAMMV